MTRDHEGRWIEFTVPPDRSCQWLQLDVRTLADEIPLPGELQEFRQHLLHPIGRVFDGIEVFWIASLPCERRMAFDDRKRIFQVV